MKVKVSEAEGQVLDWMVNKASDLNYEIKDGAVITGGETVIDGLVYDELFEPSTDWSQGGPIIERERITLAYGEDEKDWFACVGDSRRFDNDTPDGLEKVVSPTPLIAAMRCYVASKLGDAVDVPEVLCEKP